MHATTGSSRIGIRLISLARARFDPCESIGFWESEGRPPELMSADSSHGTRIENLKASMSKAIDEFKTARERLGERQ